MTVGLTSIGRDGETWDSIRPELPKPQIHLPPGALTTTTPTLLTRSDVQVTVVGRLDVRTPVGPIVVVRTESCGTIEVAGPSTAAGVRIATRELQRHGADIVVIDGALDRRVAASPSIAEAVILSTGTAIDTDPKRVGTLTRDACDILSLEVLPVGAARTIVERSDGSIAFCEGGSSRSLKRASLLAPSSDDFEAMPSSRAGVTYVGIRGALCEAALEAAARASRSIRFVVHDPTRVFVRERPYKWYAERGATIRVLRRSPVKIVTVNPIAPDGSKVAAKELLHAVRMAVPQIPVLDVMMPLGD